MRGVARLSSGVVVAAGLVAANANAQPTSAGETEAPARGAPTDAGSAERPLAAAITITPGATCLTPEALIGRIRHWLGRDTIDARLAIDVIVGRSVSFRVKEEGGVRAEREFPEPPADCGDRLAVVSFAVALAIDATILERFGGATLGAEPDVPAPEPEEPEPESEPEEPEPAKPEPQPEPAPAPDLPRDRGPEKPTEPGVEIGAALEAWAALGLVPEAVFAGYGGVHATWPDGWQARAGGLGTSESDTTLGSGVAHARLAAGRVDGCYSRGPGRLGLRGCLGIGVGRVVASGTRLDTNRTTNEPWAAAFARADVLLKVADGFGIHAGVDGFAALTRPELVVLQGDETLDSRKLPAGGATFVLGADLVLR